MGTSAHDRTARAVQALARPRVLFGIFLAVFATIWLTLWSAALSVGGCHQTDRAPERVVRVCSVSVVALQVVTTILPGTAKESRALARVLLQRGLLRASLDRPEQAASDFDRAIARATQGGPWPRRLRCPEQSLDCQLLLSMENRVAREPEGSLGRQLWEDASDRSRPARR